MNYLDFIKSNIKLLDKDNLFDDINVIIYNDISSVGNGFNLNKQMCVDIGLYSLIYDYSSKDIYIKQCNVNISDINLFIEAKDLLSKHSFFIIENYNKLKDLILQSLTVCVRDFDYDYYNTTQVRYRLLRKFGLTSYAEEYLKRRNNNSYITLVNYNDSFLDEVIIPYNDYKNNIDYYNSKYKDYELIDSDF